MGDSILFSSQERNTRSKQPQKFLSMNSDSHDEEEAHPPISVSAVLENARDIGNLDVSDYSFLEDDSVVGGNDRFVLSDGSGNSPMFFVTGRVQNLSTTPSAVVAKRSPNCKIYVDEYTTCTEPESSTYREIVRENLDKFLEALCTTSNICKIAFESSMIRHINELEPKEKDISTRFSNVGATGIFYLKRNVAVKDTLSKNSPEYLPPEMSLLPQTGPGLHRLIFPKHGYKYLPMIAVFDENLAPIHPTSFCLPRSGKAFFEIRQNAYHYKRNGSLIHDIVLVPTVVAYILNSVSENPKVDSPARKLKRRRLSY